MYSTIFKDGERVKIRNKKTEFPTYRSLYIATQPTGYHEHSQPISMWISWY